MIKLVHSIQLVSINAPLQFRVSPSSGGSLCCVIAQPRYHRRRGGRKTLSRSQTRIRVENFQATCANCIRRGLHRLFLISIWAPFDWIASLYLWTAAPAASSSIWYVANVLGSVSGEGLDCRCHVCSAVWMGEKKKEKKNKIMSENSGGALTSQTWTDAFSRRFQLCSQSCPHSATSPRAPTAADGEAGRRLHQWQQWHFCNWQRVPVSQRVDASRWTRLLETPAAMKWWNLFSHKFPISFSVMFLSPRGVWVTEPS